MILEAIGNVDDVCDVDVVSNGPGSISVRFLGLETKPNHLFILKTKLLKFYEAI